SFEELDNLVRYARVHRKKVYVTFNTLIDEDDMEEAVRQLARIAEIGPDALIVQDIGIARLCRLHFPELELHASTQLVAHNLEGVLALGEIGFKRVVLARELSLTEIAAIVKRSGGMEFECFIHGALCYSISGLCLFGAMEKGRSGNRGKCPYCCRLPWESEDGGRSLVFSMRDLRLGEDVIKLVDAGVKSLKIEGRMKSEIYVASSVKYYRQILDGVLGRGITVGDLETVFSRRTTKLYLEGRKGAPSPVDPDSLGHLGAEIGTVKRVTKDRDGLSWLRFHTSRALERHDGLQFSVCDENGKHLGMGISQMRQAISRYPVFEVAAGTDVEVLLPEIDGEDPIAPKLKPGVKIYCSASQAVRRMFPAPSFRPSDYPGNIAIDVEVKIDETKISAATKVSGAEISAEIDCGLEPAKNPEKTAEGVRKAFAKLGGTGYRLGELSVVDERKLFAPMSLVNDLRRDLVEKIDGSLDRLRRERVESAVAALNGDGGGFTSSKPSRRLKIRTGGRIPAGEWDEIVVSLFPCEEFAAPEHPSVRIALPVYTAEDEFNRLRVMVKSLLRRGFDRWEASDLATLRLLKSLGVSDLTADWTLYAFKSFALRELSELGVKRFVASPENFRDNLQYLAESGFDVEFLSQQSTPLFVSLTAPADKPEDLEVYRRGDLWVTVKPVPRTFELPQGVSERLD
ncbi:MAG: U32 family peptidase, partial [Kiritimatiellae bacterium]|nr:U32 family peptidase [Kiritimatiellia bacterium]